TIKLECGSIRSSRKLRRREYQLMPTDCIECLDRQIFGLRRCLLRLQTLMAKEWDVFISHASEDKNTFVRPLAQALDQLGVKVWYDEFTLSPGNSLSTSIDKGLAGSRFGLVVISESFIGKQWTERELQGLVAGTIAGETTIL